MTDTHAPATDDDDAFSADRLDAAVQGGTRAVIGAQLASQLLSLLILAALYRLIEPAEFGLLGMAIPLVLLADMLATFGLNVAAIQRQRVSAEQLSALFWLHLLFAALAAVLIAGAAPWLAKLYGTPRLVPVCLAMAGVPLVSSVGRLHRALLERHLRLGRLAVVRLAAQLLGGLSGIGGALAGWNIWALVAQQYVELAVLSLLVWYAESWRPGRPRRSAPIGELMRFGGYYSLSSLMFFFALQLDKVLLATLLGSTPAGRAALGMYSQAFNLMMKPVYLVTTPISGVMLPALSRALPDHALYQQLVARFYRMVGLVLLPCGAGLFLVGGEAMLVLGGPSWAKAGRLLVALAPAILVQGFINMAGSVFAGFGRTDRLFFGSLVYLVLLLQGYLAGFWLGGLWARTPWGPTLGVACSFSLVSIVVICIPYLAYCFATVGVSARRVLGQLRTAMLATIGMALLVWAVRGLMVGLTTWSEPARLFILVTTGVISYSVLARRELRWLLQQLVQLPGALRRAS